MLDGKSMKMLAFFCAFLGGCAALGLMMIGLAVVTAITAGLNTHVMIIFGVFGVGALVAYAVLQHSMKRMQKDVLKRLGLDE